MIKQRPEDLSDKELDELLAERRRRIDGRIASLQEQIAALAAQEAELEIARRSFG